MITDGNSLLLGPAYLQLDVMDLQDFYGMKEAILYAHYDKS